MVHVLYLRDRIGIHDRRFVDALVASGHTVQAAIAAGPGLWRLDADTVVDDAALSLMGADVLQVGPLPLLTAASQLLGQAPLVAVCWGTDAYQPLPAGAADILNRAAAVICDCASIAHRLTALGARPERIVPFAWGIDLGRFKMSTAPVAVLSRPRFVSTRALEGLYDHALVLHALAETGRRGRDAELHLYGRGCGRDPLIKLASELCVADRVYFHEPVDEPRLAAILMEATAWVNASHSDGTSVSLLQAMACGAGIVTSDLECAREALDSVPAWLFPPGDLSTLVDGLLVAHRLSPDAARIATSRVRAIADWRRNSALYVRTVVEACQE